MMNEKIYPDTIDYKNILNFEINSSIEEKVL